MEATAGQYRTASGHRRGTVCAAARAAGTGTLSVGVRGQRVFRGLAHRSAAHGGGAVCRPPGGSVCRGLSGAALYPHGNAAVRAGVLVLCARSAHPCQTLVFVGTAQLRGRRVVQRACLFAGSDGVAPVHLYSPPKLEKDPAGGWGVYGCSGRGQCRAVVDLRQCLRHGV